MTAPEAVVHAHALADLCGLAVVPLHRRLEEGGCSCRRGLTCATPGKHPRITWKDRPAVAPSAEEIERWWTWWPDSRVGVILGDHHCALDVDEHDDRDSGLDQLHDLQATFGPLPDTWRALTPSGGLHVWFRFAGEVAPTTHMLRPGVQLRAGRHIMAMPPSDGRAWEVSPREAALAPLPLWIPQYIAEANPDGGSGYLPLPARLRPAFRHDSYVAAARSMARIGLPFQAIVAALVITDHELGDPPKNDREELKALVIWALDAQAGDGNPYQRFAGVRL